jgi:hypothetical protein
MCVKCGQRVQPEKTGIGFIDFVEKINPWLVRHLGTLGGNIVAVLLLVLLFTLIIGIGLYSRMRGFFGH